MKNKKLLIGLISALAILIAAVAIIVVVNKPQGEVGAKNVNVTLVFKDKTEKNYQLKTDAEFLADALLEKELITEEEYKSGYYTVIDGVTADYNVDKSWWCVTKDGEMTSVGMNELALVDGDSYEITYTIN